MASWFAPKMPEPKPPAPMPDPEAPAVLEARRRASAEFMSRAGRTSTILSPRGQRPAAAAAPVSYDTFASKTL